METAFVTGSRAYGVPRVDSDIDLAVLVSTSDASTLRNLSGTFGKVMFGTLNLIIFNADDPNQVRKYHNWKTTNEQLKKQAPVTREHAIKALDASDANNLGYSGDY